MNETYSMVKGSSDDFISELDSVYTLLIKSETHPSSIPHPGQSHRPTVILKGKLKETHFINIKQSNTESASL